MAAFHEPNNTIRCRCCDFPFKTPRNEHPSTVFCPSCGSDQACSMPTVPPIQAVGDLPAEHHAPTETGTIRKTEKRPAEKEKRKDKRYDILFFTVCLQLSILVFSPLYILNALRLEKSEKNRDGEKQAQTTSTESKTVENDDKRYGPQFLQYTQLASLTPKPEIDFGRIPVAQEFASPQEVLGEKVPSKASFSKSVLPTASASPEHPFDPFAGQTLAGTHAPLDPFEATAGTIVEDFDAEKNSEDTTDVFAADIKENDAGEPPVLPNSLPGDPFFGASAGAELLVQPYEVRLEKARAQLEKCCEIITMDSERVLLEGAEAVRAFETLGQPVPAFAYWILSQAYASQSWGEALVTESLPIENMVFSSDDRWLLTQCSDHSVWIRDMQQTKESNAGFKLDSSETPFVKLIFTPDFRFAIGGDIRGTIRIWDTSLKHPAESVKILPGTVKGLRDLQVSPDGRWLVAYGGKAEHDPPSAVSAVRQNSTAINEQEVSKGGLTVDNRIRNSDDNRSNLVVEHRMTVDLVPNQVSSNEIVLVNYLNRQEGASNQTSQTPQADLHVVWLWDLELIRSGIDPQPIALRGHEQAIRAMAISEDSRWLVSGSDDATARIYNLKGAFPGSEQAVLKGHELGIGTIVIAGNNRWIATGSQDNTIRLWTFPDSMQDTLSSSFSATLTGHVGWISALASDKTGTRLISGSYDQTLRVWEIPAGDIRRVHEREPVILQNDQGPVKRLILSEDGKLVVSLGGDASLRIRQFGNDLQSLFDPRCSLLIRNRTLPITQIALTSDCRWLSFNYINQRDPSASGIRLWPLHLKDLMESIDSN